MQGMNYIGKFISNFRDFYNDINAATLTGAIDVVVVEQPDGTFSCSPFHVRFGKMGVLRSREKVVDMEVNGEPREIHMKLGESGEAFFVEELHIDDLGDEDIPPHLACSPIPSEPYLNLLRHPVHEKEEESCPEVSQGTFQPELIVAKVSEKVRRISLVSGECRPMDSDRLEAEMGVAKPTPELQDKWNNAEKQEAQSAKWPEKPVEGSRPNAGATGKRKRRKKALLKKRGSKKGEQRELNEQPPGDNIFVLEDLNPPSQPPTVDVKPSTSAPNFSLPALKPMNNFHFFSDTEASPGSSPATYPSSPTLSDSEMERARHTMDAPVDAGQSWRWGELPSPPNHPLQESDEQPANLDHGDDEDVESGKGASLPHSPHGVDGGAQPSKASAEAVQELMKFSVFDDTTEMSLCGGLEGAGPSDEAFNHGRVTFEDLCANWRLLESPDLVVRLGTKYYSYEVACNVVMSSLMFQRPLPVSTLEKVVSPKGGKAGYTSWFSWGRQENKAMDATGDHLKSLEGVTEESMSKLLENKGINTPSNGVTFTSQSNFASLGHSNTIPISTEMNKCMYRKTLRLSSAQIASLNLKEGANQVMFSVTTAYQGTTRCKCHIYKWRYDDRVVISDIDGTITKSDVLGHILPIVGKDWAQSGVAQLFTKIKNNGYKLLYLSSRAIGQAGVTREYLRSIKQGDLSLPDGPLLLNPTSLVSAFHREVIERKPEEFKISCLRDIQALFPADTKPFYAGYGNKVNDVWAYRAVGIPIFRIFTINHRGELKHEMTQTFQSSYTGQSCIVNDLFPIET